MTRAEVQYHRVTVTVTPADDPEDRPEVDIRFACTAPEGAECRTYPDCDCESFTEGDVPGHDGSGHPYIAGRQCWLADWFDGNGAVFDGPDSELWEDHEHPAIARAGTIDVQWECDYINWHFVTIDGEVTA